MNREKEKGCAFCYSASWSKGGFKREEAEKHPTWVKDR